MPTVGRVLFAVAVAAMLTSGCSRAESEAIEKAATDAASAATSSAQCLQLWVDERTTSAHTETLLRDMQTQVSDALSELDEMSPDDAGVGRLRTDVRAAVDRTATLIAAAREYVDGMSGTSPESLIGDFAGNARDLSALAEGE